MSAFLAVLSVLAALWLVSRACVFLIERTWPPLGTMLRIDGLDMHVRDVPAAPGAPVLLLIHGASGNLREPLAALSAALGGRFRLIGVDRPGHGHSSRGPRAISDPALQADLIAHLLDARLAAPCIALGHSWGAAVAAGLAQRHPDKVAGLVLVAPATHPWPGGVSRRTRFFALPYVGRLAAEIAVVPLGLLLAAGAVRTIFAPDAAPHDYSCRVGALLAVRPKTFVANCRDVVDLYGHLVRLSARYCEISAPTEIVTGDRDPIVSAAIHSYGLARDIPGARLIILQGAGHMPHWSRTPEVAAAIERVAGSRARAARAAE